MIYEIAERKEASGTNKAGFKTGVAQRLAAGAVVLCPASDHDMLAEELHRQLNRESMIFDISEILAQYLEATLAEPHRESMAVVYVTTDATAEPADELMDREIRAIDAGDAAPSEEGVLCAFVTASGAPTRRWLYPLFGRILFHR